MSKTKIFLSLVAVSLLLTGCKFPWQKASTPGPSGQEQPKGESVTEKIGSSLKEAFGLGRSMKCTYTAPEGGLTTILVKDKKVRIEGAQFGSGEGKSGGMINDGQWIYIWDNEKKEGMKYQVSALKTAAESQEEETSSLKNWADFGKWAEENEKKYSMQCSGAALADSQFVPPADVQFQDLTEMFLQIEKMKQQTQGVRDEGESTGSEEQSQIPSGLTQQLLESVRQGVAGASDTSEESPAEETPTE